MADRTSGGRPLDATKGTTEGQQDRISGRSDVTQPDIVATAYDSGDAAAAADRSAGDREHAAGDEDPMRRVTPRAQEITRGIRQRSARQRQHSARALLDAAARRDRLAQARDVAALARDQAAAARDLAMTQLYAIDEQDADADLVPDPGIVGRAAAAARTRAAQRRARAAEHLALAAQDRQAAARDREHAADEREHALADRDALARQAASLETDAVTGARPRAAGIVDLVHELDRCSRTSDRLVIAYVDVVGARTLGEGHGRAADELLRRTVAHIHEHLRSYDLIIRLGITEFLCVMSSMTLPDARQRFGLIATAIGADAITTGFAALTSHETAAELIARAGGDVTDSSGTGSTADRGGPTR